MQIGTGVKIDEVVQYLQNEVVELLTDHHQGGFKKMGDFLTDVMDELQWREDNPNQLLGQSTGIKSLDYTLDGLQDQTVINIAGRPGSGKSAFALKLIKGLAATQKPWFRFDLEMSGKSCARRALVESSGVSNAKFKSPTFDKDEYSRIATAVGVIQDLPVFIDASPSLSIQQIRSRLKAAQVKHGQIGGIMIDHIGLIKKDAKKGDTEAMNMIADALLEMSKEFDCPMVQVCQLNRGVEQRADKRPMMSDLKQSGKIEENADVIILLYREDYYDEEAAKVTEVNVAKNRDGETKVIYMKHDMSTGRYEELPGYEPEPKHR